MKRLCAVLVLSVSVILAGSVWAAQGRGQAQSKAKGKPEAKGAAGEKGKPEAKGEKAGKPKPPPFAKADVDMIRVWFRNNQSGLPPGLAKREQLPPGLQKHLVRNGTLPPGLQKKLHPLPAQLEVQLPRLAVGYRRFVIGGQLVLVEERTFLVIDIIPDVIVIR